MCDSKDCFRLKRKGTRMFNDSGRQLLLIACLVGCAAPVDAAVIAYDFSGTLSQPVDGSSTFSGTLTFDTDLHLSTTSIAPGAGTYYSGVPVNPSEPPVSLTFTLGNLPSSTFGTMTDPEVFVSHVPQGTDEFQVSVEYHLGTQVVTAQFTLTNNNLVQPGFLTSNNIPSTLNVSSFSKDAILALYGANNFPYNGEVGTVTALAAGPGSSVPEPASLVVFACLGAAVFVRARKNRGSRDR